MTASYGPHREQDHPQTVTILGRHKHPQAEETGIPRVIKRQRAAISDRAHRDALLLLTHAVRDGVAACGAPPPWSSHVVLPTSDLTMRRVEDGTVDCDACRDRITGCVGARSEPHHLAAQDQA